MARQLIAISILMLFPFSAHAATSASFWLQSSLMRVYPTTPSPGTQRIRIPAARNESTNRVEVACTIAEEPGVKVQIRRVGYVPMRHHTVETDPTDLEGVGHIPGLVPDPLFPEQKLNLGPQETQSFSSRPGSKRTMRC